MPIKRRTGEWKPGGTELFRQASALYSTPDLDHFASFLSVRTHRRPEFDARILNTVERLYADLHYKARPSSPAMNAALKALAASLASTLEAIEKLDHDSRNLIATIASRDPRDTQTEAPNLSDFGQERLSHRVQAVCDLQRWGEEALIKLPRDKGGRPDLAEVKDALDSLNKIWPEFNRKAEQRLSEAAPKLKTVDGRKRGDGLDFCRAVLQPVLDHYGIRSDLESAYSQVLYGKTPPESGMVSSIPVQGRR